MTVQKSWHWCA